MPHKPSPPAAERSLTFALRGIRAVSDAPQLTPLSPPLGDEASSSRVNFFC